MSSAHRRLGLVSLCGIFVGAGCASGDDANPAGPTPTTASLSGQVISSRDGTPVATASVRLSDTLSALTDVNGKYRFDGLAPTTRITATVSKEGFFQGIEPTALTVGMESRLDIAVMPAKVTAKIQALQGGEVNDGVGSKVLIPPASLVTRAGVPVTGEVTVSVSAIDPTVPEEMRAFPGDFSATRLDGTPTMLETVVPMAITAITSDGQDLTVKAGMGLEVTFPVSPNLSRTAVPAVELWSLDPVSGVWKEEGMAMLVADTAAPSGVVYRGRVTHLSWWNVDKPISTKTCIRGCVKTLAGVAAPGVSVTAAGVTYMGQSNATTGADGCFAMDVKRAESIKVFACSTNGSSAPIALTSSSVSMSIGSGRNGGTGTGGTSGIDTGTFDAGVPNGAGGSFGGGQGGQGGTTTSGPKAGGSSGDGEADGGVRLQPPQPQKLDDGTTADVTACQDVGTLTLDPAQACAAMTGTDITGTGGTSGLGGTGGTRGENMGGAAGSAASADGGVVTCAPSASCGPTGGLCCPGQGVCEAPGPAGQPLIQCACQEGKWLCNDSKCMPITACGPALPCCPGQQCLAPNQATCMCGAGGFQVCGPPPVQADAGTCMPTGICGDPQGTCCNGMACSIGGNNCFCEGSKWRCSMPPQMDAGAMCMSSPCQPGGSCCNAGGSCDWGAMGKCNCLAGMWSCQQL